MNIYFLGAEICLGFHPEDSQYSGSKDPACSGKQKQNKKTLLFQNPICVRESYLWKVKIQE